MFGDVFPFLGGCFIMLMFTNSYEVPEKIYRRRRDERKDQGKENTCAVKSMGIPGS